MKHFEKLGWGWVVVAILGILISLFVAYLYWPSYSESVSRQLQSNYENLSNPNSETYKTISKANPDAIQNLININRSEQENFQDGGRLDFYKNYLLIASLILIPCMVGFLGFARIGILILIPVLMIQFMALPNAEFGDIFVIGPVAVLAILIGLIWEFSFRRESRSLN